LKGQGPKKVITVRKTPPYGHTPTYQLSFTYLERQKYYGPDKNILFKKQLFNLEVKGQGPTKVITVCDTPPYGHAYTNYLLWGICQRQTCIVMYTTVQVRSEFGKFAYTAICMRNVYTLI
jgi:hypothetical protein